MGLVGEANALVGQVVTSPVAAAWFQAIGSLITLLAVSLVPWLRGRARQSAFLLRARIIVQTARITLIRLQRSVDKTGELKDLHREISGLANDFTNFPVEELGRNAATAFHECRLAFLNVDLLIDRVKNPEGVLMPYSRSGILKTIRLFLKAFDSSGKIFRPRRGDKYKPSKAEQTINDEVNARLPEFILAWKKHKEIIKAKDAA